MDMALPGRAPETGELVQVRSRRWLVEDVELPGEGGGSAQVALACADDDAQGQSLTVHWDLEPDRRILDEEGWSTLAAKGFDAPRQFAAFFHTLRWGCTTATNPDLFQAPFRAGIKIDAYQMEPLRKALRLPRVNLFIADDTGLGKTIEAGLIARELILRRKAKAIVVAAPPSVLEQWKGELEERFGLVFEVLDRGYVSRMRRERGFGVNPWRTHSRFLVSHNLLIDPAYSDPMREWLGGLLPGSLLILDEAHHAAPASGGRYGIDSKFTRAVRDLSARFEHRLFLSATPHNGHSNSFSALLEILDPFRFTRGVKVRGRGDLEDVMVRRLKEDIRGIQGGFPRRNVRPVVIDGLPEDTPEIALSNLLDEYRAVREERHGGASKRKRAAAGLLVVGLQQRLLSSVEAFARTLGTHRKTVRRQRQEALGEAVAGRDTTDGRQDDYLVPAGPDDERGELTDEELDAEESRQVAALTEASMPTEDADEALWRREQDILDRMQSIAEEHRTRPDAKTRRLIDWIRENQCPDLPAFGASPKGEPPRWNNRRVLVFTENRQGTKRHLRDTLWQAIERTDEADGRIEIIDGLTTGERRKQIQRRFNSDPSEDPLRILIATDAAREGLNFQAHCSDLFHYDLPWNPGRIEQRNGRIDRKLQPRPEVNCHYFVLPQRKEDRVLQVLVGKTETIRRELGSLSKVVDDDVERRLRKGIRHRDIDRLTREIEGIGQDRQARQAAEEELEDARDRQEGLERQIDQCRKLLEKSREWTGFDPTPFQDALSCSLELLDLPPLTKAEGAEEQWKFPEIEQRGNVDPSWISTLDSLRAPRKPDQKIADWRKNAPIRPVVFKDTERLSEDTVHLHLDQRIAQRLLARFRAQGFVYHDLSRACLAQARDSTPRVVLLGRLSLYGKGAERLHEEIVPVAARWTDPARRQGPLKAYERTAETRTLDLLNESLRDSAVQPDKTVRDRLMAAVPEDIRDLQPQLEPRALEFAETARQKLADRGDREARQLKETLERQHGRVKEHLAAHTAQSRQLALDLNPEERRQLEADVRHWQRRLEQFARDIETEPQRIREFYQVRAQRVEPVGLVYLWPDTN